MPSTCSYKETWIDSSGSPPCWLTAPSITPDAVSVTLISVTVAPLVTLMSFAACTAETPVAAVAS